MIVPDIPVSIAASCGTIINVHMKFAIVKAEVFTGGSLCAMALGN